MGVAATSSDHWAANCTTAVVLAWNVTITEDMVLQNLTLIYGDAVLYVDPDAEASSVIITLDQPHLNYTLNLTAYVELQNGSLLQESSTTSIATGGCTSMPLLSIEWVHVSKEGCILWRNIEEGLSANMFT